MTFTRATIAAIAVSLAGCGGRAADLSLPLSTMPPAAVDDHLVVVELERTQALVLDVSGDAPPSSPHAVPLLPHPTRVEPRAGHSNELLVLCAGQPDDGSAEPARPGLVVLGSDGGRKEFRYDSAFNAIAQSDDGKFAFLYFDGSAQLGSDVVLFNPNEVAVVDLDGTAEPVVRALRSFSGAPTKVAFSPELTLNGTAGRRLAVVLFGSDLALLDLDHPDRAEYTVELSRPGAFQLAQALFSASESKIYLRANGSNDVFVLTLSDQPDAPPGKNDFIPSVNQLGAGIAPSDMAIYSLTDRDSGETTTRLLVASPGASQLVVIEPDTSNVSTTPLAGPATSIRLFTQPSPRDPNPAPRALLYTPGAAAVAFVDLEGLETRGARNVELLAIPQVYGELVDAGDGTVMLLHQNTGLSLLDLGKRTVTQIQGPNLLGAVADPAVKKLWLATGDRVGFLDLSAGVHPNEVRVDEQISALVAVPSATRPRVVVTHPSSTGWATVLDAVTPTDLGKAYSMRGYLIEDMFGGEK